MTRVACLACLTMGMGCAEEELPGFYWDITVAGAENLCTGNGASYTDSFEYRLLIELNDVSMWIGEDNWANGFVDGCEVGYDSIAWADYRDNLEIQWQLQGLATVNIGGPGVGCVESDGYDWIGTETFTVTNSAHPDVQAGCTYTLDVFGTYVQEIPVQ